MMVQRSWSGLEVALIDTPAGATRAPASTRCRLGFHVGRPVRAVCRFDGRTHSRLQSRGDIDLVPAGAPGVWEDDRSTRILRVALSEELVATAAVGLGLDPAKVALAPQFQLRDPRLGHIAFALEAELGEDAPVEPLYGDSLAMALAAHLIGHYRTGGGALRAPSHGLSRQSLGRVTEYVEAHLDGPLSLADLAAASGLGVSHFKTLFKRSTGVSAHRYVVERRVERARLLLVEGKTPIAEIALRTGFADPSHLARWMRRLLGVTPAKLARDPR